MRYIILLALLFFSHLLYGQSSTELEKNAIEYETSKNYIKALSLYNHIKLRDSLSIIGNRASQKINTLISLILNELNGTWKLRQNRSQETDIKFTELLKIKNGKAHFIEVKDGKEKAVDVINLEILPYSPSVIFDFPKIKLKNGEIWSLYFRTINNEKRLIWKQKINNSGALISIIDDRSIIRDAVKRKEALEGEVLTYYILEN